MRRTSYAAAIFGGAMALANADPVVLGDAQMDAVTVGTYTHAESLANAIGARAVTNTSTAALASNGRSYFPGLVSDARSAAFGHATGPLAHVEASVAAGITKWQPDLLGIVSQGEVVAQGTATGPSAFTSIGAAVFTLNGQTYLTGHAAASSTPELVMTTAPIPLTTTSIRTVLIDETAHYIATDWLGRESHWTPAIVDAGNTMISFTSNEMPGSTIDSYTSLTPDPDGDDLDGGKATLKFTKPPQSYIPPVTLMRISGIVRVDRSDLVVRPLR